MTNEEAIDVLNNTAWLGTDVGIKVYPAVKMAVEALEKKIPKKPIFDGRISGALYWYCPSCNEVVKAHIADAPILNEYNHDHCGGCGQAIDWSGVE